MNVVKKLVYCKQQFVTKRYFSCSFAFFYSHQSLLFIILSLVKSADRINSLNYFRILIWCSISISIHGIMFQMLRARLNGMSSEGKAEYEKGLIKAFETLMKVSFLFVKIILRHSIQLFYCLSFMFDVLVVKSSLETKKERLTLCCFSSVYACYFQTILLTLDY